MNNLSISDEETVISYIGQLPHTKLLNLAKTPEQKNRWFQMASYNLIVSRCWRAKIRKEPFIWENLEKDLININQWYYDIILSEVDCLQSLWKLVEKVSSQISIFALKESLQNTNLETDCKDKSFISNEHINIPVTLFGCLVETSINNGFYVCLKPYHEVSINKRIKALKSLQTAYINKTIKHHEQQFLKSLSSQFYPNKELQKFLLVVQTLQKNDPEIQQLFNNYCQAHLQKGKLMITGFSRTRSSKDFEKFYSFVWNHGNICFASSTGGVYPLQND